MNVDVKLMRKEVKISRREKSCLEHQRKEQNRTTEQDNFGKCKGTQLSSGDFGRNVSMTLVIELKVHW